MDLKRLKEWIGTAEGLGTTVIGLLTVITSMAVTTADTLGKAFASVGLSSAWWPRTGGVLIIAAFGLFLWRSFRRFAQASRLEQPDAFTLHPTDPTTLIGRTEDLARLLNCVKQHRLVLLDGESGCGKSALVSAGLVPELQHANSLLPVSIRDWGDDWVRGPLAAVLDALFHAVSQTDRDRLGWTSPPDLAADTPKLASDLEARLKSVVSTLARRALLIADQFDDYQARHCIRFLDDDANWLIPTALIGVNRFWGLVSTGLAVGHIHLLVVTRSDTAAGLSCVRFLGEELTATRTLARVEAEYLRPLLRGIAADEANPAIVSHPEGGWNELRERLERDLKAEGAILMQQVRTVLLGLRQLPLLTPRHYTAAGGLRGVETLVISRALRRAGEAARDGLAGRRNASAVLGEMVLPGSPNQPPKARRALLSHLVCIVGDRSSTEAILAALQHEEVVRPAEAVGGESAWQLDHDYLARAVLAQARQADRWAMALQDGKTRYHEAAGNWRRRYAALLPVGTLARLCWERGRGRLRFGTAASYASISAIKPAVAVLSLMFIGVAAHTWNQDRLLTAEANRLINRFGGSGGAEAVLQTWSAPEPLRQRIYELVLADEGRLELAVRAGWPLAHAGLEPARMREVITALRMGLAQERDRDMVSEVAYTYLAAVARLHDATDVKAAGAFLRARLEQERDSDIAGALAQAYAAVVAQLHDAADVKAAAAFLRARLEQERDRDIAGALVQAYADAAARLHDAEDVKAAATFLRMRLAQERDSDIATRLAQAYADVAAQLYDAADVKAEAAALRTQLAQERDSEIASRLAQAYAAVAAQLHDAADVKAAAAVLRTRLEQERDSEIAYYLAQAYAAVAAQLHDAADVKAAAAFLRARLGQERDSYISSSLAQAYADVAAELHDAAGVKAAAAFLRTQLEQERDREIAYLLAHAYRDVAARLHDAADVKAEAAALRAQLEQEPDSSIADALALAYGNVAARLHDAEDVKTATAVLRTRLVQEAVPDFRFFAPLARDYAAVATRLHNAADVKAEAAFLRARLGQERDSYISSSLAQAYADVAGQLHDAADVKAAAAFLRARLEQEQDSEIAEALAYAYADVVARLHDAADVKAEAAALRTRLEQAQDAQFASNLALAYGVVAGTLVKRADAQERSVLVREILMLAGHPFLVNSGDLLATLKPAGVDFDNNVGAAVMWAVQTYGVRPEHLRPLPLPP